MQKTNAVTNVPAHSPKKMALVVLTLAATTLMTQAHAVNGPDGFGLESAARTAHTFVNGPEGFGLE